MIEINNCSWIVLMLLKFGPRKLFLEDMECAQNSNVNAALCCDIFYHRSLYMCIVYDVKNVEFCTVMQHTTFICFANKR